MTHVRRVTVTMGRRSVLHCSVTYRSVDQAMRSFILQTSAAQAVRKVSSMVTLHVYIYTWGVWTTLYFPDKSGTVFQLGSVPYLVISAVNMVADNMNQLWVLLPFEFLFLVSCGLMYFLFPRVVMPFCDTIRSVILISPCQTHTFNVSPDLLKCVIRKVSTCRTLRHHFFPPVGGGGGGGPGRPPPPPAGREPEDV